MTVTVGEAGTVQSSKQTCATWASQVTNRNNKLSFAAVMYSRNRSSTHFTGRYCSYLPHVRKPWSLCSQDLGSIPGLLPCSFHALLFLFCLTCFCEHLVPFFLVFIYSVSLPSPSSSHLWTHFICLMLPVVISLSELLPASCFHLSSSRCYVSVCWVFY